MRFQECGLICLTKGTKALLFVVFTVLFGHSALAQSWNLLAPTGAKPAARGMNGTPGVYDATSNRMIIFGGRDGSGQNLNDVWVLENANGLGGTPQWLELIPNGAAGSPPARSGHSTVYDPVNNRLIVFGGCGGDCLPVLNDVWVLTNANGLGGTPAWTQLQVAGGPAARTNAAVAYDPTDNVLIVFGGQDGSANPCSTFSDLWMLGGANGLGTALWAQPGELFGTPPVGQNGASILDYETLAFLGGIGMVNGTCTATNAVTALDLLGGFPNPFVSFFNFISEGAAGSPAARSFASTVIDTITQRTLLFGGVDASGNYLNDVWSFGAGMWSQINPKNSPPAARSGQVAILDSVHQRMTIFGGEDASGVLDSTWVLTVPGVSGLTCSASTGVPRILRAEGLTEQMGDLVFNCIGGTPTPAGEAIPEYTVTYTLNSNITSRRLPEAPDLSEALLIIDDAFPANPVPPYTHGPSSPPQILCTPLGSHCTATGTGGTPSPYQTQPNVFVGKQTGVDTLEWKIPLDPPGPNNHPRVIRLTNVRANAPLVGPSPPGFTGEFLATVAIQGAQPLLPGGSQQLLVAFALPGALASITASASIPRCEPHNAVLLGGKGTAAFDFSVQTQEGYAYAFQYRNYGTQLIGPPVFPPILVEQNIPGFPYDTETGFYSPSLFTTAPTLGLADFGTRIHLSLGSISAGTHLFVPTTITLTGEYAEGTPAGQLQLVQANENGNSAPGYEPVAATAMVGTTPVAQASVSGSTAYATYEVIYANPSVEETATIPVAVAFTNKPAIGEVMATTSFAPLGTSQTANETSPIPRFTNLAPAQEAFTITSCPAQ